MPEGDMVLRTAQRLHEALAGQELTVTDLRWPGIETVDLTGRVTLEVTAYGKHILHRVAADPSSAGPEDAWTIRSHLRMEGRWRIEPAAGAGAVGTEATGAAARAQAGGGAQRGLGRSAARAGRGRSALRLRGTGASAARRAASVNDHVRAIVGTAEWTCVGTRLGMLDVVRTSGEHTLLGHLGPDILADDWAGTGRGIALANLDRVAKDSPGTAIATALLDQQVVAGLGTIWTSEPLFMAGVNPWTPVSNVPVDQRERVIDLAHKHIRASVLRWLQHTTTGNPRRTRYVHGQMREQCVRCGTPIAVDDMPSGGALRPFFWCPTCQAGSTHA